MRLRVRHGSGFKPTVKDLVHTLQHGARSLFGRDFHLVDRFTMQIIDTDTRQFRQFIDATNANCFRQIFIGPNGNGCPPKAIPRDGPITGIRQPIVEASFLDFFGYPICLFIIFHDPITNLFHFDKPRRHGLVNQRCIRPPAKGIRVYQDIFLYQTPHFLEDGDDDIVRLFHMHALGNGYFIRKVPIGIDGTGDITSLLDNSVRQTHAVIVFSKGRCLMNDTRTGIIRDVSVGQDAEEFTGLFRMGKKVKQGLVPFSHQDGSLEFFFDFVQFLGLRGFPFFGIHGLINLTQARLAQNVPFATGLVQDFDIIQFWIDTQCQVGRQGPRSGGPRDKVHIVGFFSNNGETHHDGRILDILVIETGFKIGQGCGTAGRVRHNLVSLVDQSLVK
mmetsp:Transcript_1995/g.3954  ORF Transcript_1995/g.3954 Transcript_1995/m.3954 type:complete len:389 (+) Transcript_1995:2385-3551(+)